MSSRAEQSIKIYLEKMKHLEDKIFEFIDAEGEANSEYQNIISFLESQQFKEDRNDLQSLLHLLLKISNNHHRNPEFYIKIGRIISHFKEDIKIYYSNYETFQLFKSNKRLLLFLFKEGIIIPNKAIFCAITSYKYKQAFYPHYFLPEFQSFYDENFIQLIKDEIQKNSQSSENDSEELFEKKRETGENDHIICEMIRNDSIDQFTEFINHSNLPMTSNIEVSIFETNEFLLKNQTPTLIEYAAFCGSFNVFKYLCDNLVQLTPPLWLYSIHGNNDEIIKILEENKINPEEETYKDVFVEAIKCHHNQLAKSIQENKVKDKSTIIKDVSSQIIKYYNFCFIPTEYNFTEVKNFCDFCRYNYFYMVKQFLLVENLPINAQTILNSIYFNTISNFFFFKMMFFIFVVFQIKLIN